MADNNIYGVDFIARCMAGEALDKAGQKSWTLVAGNNISILSDEEEKTETISAEIEIDDALSSTSENPVQNKVIYEALQNVEIDVDDALSTTSTNPVENRVITNALKTKPTSVDTNGTPINDQKIMALTRQQYNAIQNKDANTYYMITDDPVPEAPMVVRTAYVDMLDDCTLTIDGNAYSYEFDAPANFEKVDVYIRCHYIWRNTTWTGDNKVNLAHQLSITPDQSSATDGRTVVWRHGFDKANMAGVNWQGDFLDQAITLRYDSTTNKLKMTVGAPSMWRCEDGWSGDTTANSPVTVSGFVLDAIGYVAYGPDTINVTTGLTAGDGIDMTNDVISIDMPVGSEIGLSINSSTYVLTATLYDQNTIPISTATIDLPLESMVVNGSYDDTTKKIILTLQSGQTVEFSVADLVSGLETSAHAASTYQTIAGMSNYETISHASSTYQTQAGMSSYATTSDISDMATQTWVGQQGFLTSADEVPTVGSSDDGKVLTASYSGGTGSYSWQTPSGGGGSLPVGAYGQFIYYDASDAADASPFTIQNPLDLDMDGSFANMADEGSVPVFDGINGVYWGNILPSYKSDTSVIGKTLTVVNDIDPTDPNENRLEWGEAGGTTKRFFPNIVRKDLRHMPPTYDPAFYDYAMLLEGDLKNAVQDGADYIAVHLTVEHADNISDFKIYSNGGTQSNPNFQPMQFYDGGSQADDITQNNGRITFGYGAPQGVQSGWVFFKSWDTSISGARDLSTSNDLAFYAQTSIQASIWIDEVKVVSFQTAFDPTD